MGPVAAKGLDSETPTDTQHPRMYEGAVYILGAIGAMCVIGIVVLAFTAKTVDAGLVAIGASAVGGLVTMLAPRIKGNG